MSKIVNNGSGMTMRVFVLTAISLCLAEYSAGQKFDGFVVTKRDSIFKGYMRVNFVGLRLAEILLTDDKRKTPRTFKFSEIRLYAYKKDTFEILKPFYPFEEENYAAEDVVAKFIIRKGKLRLYSVTFEGYGPGTDFSYVGSQGITQIRDLTYPTYVIKDREGVLHGVKSERNKFQKSIEFLLEDNKELLAKITARELRFRDMKKIIEMYNAR
jgi:hypothetical protein